MLDYKVVSLVEDKLGEVQDQRERDAMIKYLIQEADFEIAYYLVCTYITKRNVMDLHKSIISNISNNKILILLKVSTNLFKKRLRLCLCFGSYHNTDIRISEDPCNTIIHIAYSTYRNL